MIKKVILLFLVWRISLFLIAHQAPSILPKFANRFPYVDLLKVSGLPYWIWSFANFDGVHYLRIAQDGYAYQFTQAFFPLYPIIIRFFASLTSLNLIVSGLLISNLAFLAALIIFYKLLSKKMGEGIAFWSTIFLLVFPASFYFGSFYTEGLFFLLTILAFYLMEKQQNFSKNVILASILAGFASGTKFIGIFLTPALLVTTKLKSIWPAILGPLGILVYMLYLYWDFDNPLYFLTSQQIFGQERETTAIILLPQVFYRYFKILTTTSGLPFANAAFELASTIFAIIAAITIRKKIPASWLIFSLAAIIVPTLTGTLASMPRYIIVAFPIYIALASLRNWKLKTVVALLLAATLVLSTALFTRGYWVA